MHEAILGKKKASEFLKKADFVDEYRGKQIPQGKKSVTIRLTIGSNEKLSLIHILILGKIQRIVERKIGVAYQK